MSKTIFPNVSFNRGTVSLFFIHFKNLIFACPGTNYYYKDITFKGHIFRFGTVCYSLLYLPHSISFIKQEIIQNYPY